MSTRQRILGCCIVLILLLPTLFFPFGADHFTFLRGGELVMNGGRMYVDFYDVKPPLIYYIFGSVGAVFGYTEITLRGFDLFWQLCTAFSLVFVVSRVMGNSIYGFAGGAAYALSYTALNFSETLQCEGFAGIGIVWLIYLQMMSKETYWRYPLWGIALGWMTALKFPLGILFLAIIIDDIVLRKQPAPQMVLKWFVIGVSLLCTIAVLLSPYLNPEVFAGYRRISEYLVFYASTPPINLDFVRTSIKSIAEFFGDNYSLAFLVCIAGALFSVFSETMKELHNTRSRRLIWLTVLIAGLLLFSVVIERKLLPYRFSRMYVPLSLLSGIGIVVLYREWILSFSVFSKNLKLLTYMMLGCMLLFSPLPRWLSVAGFGYNALFSKQDANIQRVQNSDLVSSPRLDIVEVSRYIRAQPLQGKVFVISTIASTVYYFLNEKPISRFISPTMYYSVISPKGMKSEMQNEVQAASWLVVQTNDRHPEMYGHDRSSSEMLANDPVVSDYVQKNYSRRASIGVFDIYSKNKPPVAP